MKKYVFKPYTESFPLLFQAEKKRLLSPLPYKLQIEHVGSTAVPGLGGKGIIDIAIGLENLPLNSLSKELADLGYIFRPTGTTKDRVFYRIDLPDEKEGTRRYHLHVMDIHGAEWKNMLHFRDRLRDDAEAAGVYGALKQKLVDEVNEEGALYRALKQPFFDRILKKP